MKSKLSEKLPVIAVITVLVLGAGVHRQASQTPAPWPAFFQESHR